MGHLFHEELKWDKELHLRGARPCCWRASGLTTAILGEMWAAQWTATAPQPITSPLSHSLISTDKIKIDFMHWDESSQFSKKHLWRKKAVAAILDLIQLSSESLWQLSKLLKGFLSHSKSQEYFQTGFKNSVLSYKSSFRYSFYERVNPKWQLQAGVIEHFSFSSAGIKPQAPDLQGRLQAKNTLVQTRPPVKSSSLSCRNDRPKEELSPPLRSLELLFKIWQARSLEYWLIFDDRALLVGAYQFAPIKKQNKGSFVRTKDN